jgi:predicted nucleic acid-binding protein
VRWLLDTNIVSEGIRPRPEPSVLRWVASQPADGLSISDVTLAELRVGSAGFADDVQRNRFEHWYSHTIEFFHGRTLPLTVEILVHWLNLARQLRMRGKPQSAPDLLIASTAHIHGLIVVSRNVRDFASTGVVVYDPWSGETHRMDSP